VFKADKQTYKKGLRSPLGFAITQRVLKKYSRRFFVKLEQVAICQDHIHCLVRLSKRSLGQHFFRVVAGQIAQEFQKTGLMKVTGTPGVGATESRKPAQRPLFRRVGTALAVMG
jgi:REP-associated tyrosine transposase